MSGQINEETMEIIKRQTQRIVSTSASIFLFWRTGNYYYYCFVFYFLYKSM